MADVTPPSARDRAQLVLVGALVLAVVFVGLALVTNTVIFTENLATRQSVDSDTTVDYRQAANAQAHEALHSANYASNDSDYPARFDRYSTQIELWATASARYHVTSGHLSSLSTKNRTKGTRVIQDDDGTFEPADPSETLLGLDPLGLLGNDRWLVANDSRIRDFRMRVDGESLGESDENSIVDILDLLLYGGDDIFWTQIESAEGTWQMAVYEDSGPTDAVNVTVERPDGSVATCSVAPDSDGTVWINVTRGTIHGDGDPRRCEALSFLDEIEGGYDVYYVNGDSAVGTYQFIADKKEEPFRQDVADHSESLLTLIEGLLNPDVDDTDTYHERWNDGDPYTTTAIYDAAVGVSYQTEGIDYSTTVRVPSEKFDPAPSAGQAPEVTIHSSVDNSNLLGNAEYEVDWSVSDPDGDLDEVEVVLVGSSGVVDNTSTSSSSGSTTLTDSGGGGGDYRIAVAAVDDVGNRHCLRASDEADGSGLDESRFSEC